MNIVKFQRLHNDAKIPTRAYVPEKRLSGSLIEGSVGYDLYSISGGFLLPGVHTIIPLGFAAEFDPGYGAFIFDRSGMGVRGVTHFAGVIDPDYRDEWKVILYNSTNETLNYTKDKAIAQVVFLQVNFPDWEEAESLTPSLRGKKGWGSTDAPVGRTIEVGMGLKSKGGMGGG